jgi:Ca2+-binding EF-hand superfamily protein
LTDKIKQDFEKFDSENTGYISQTSLMKAFAKMGRPIKNHEVEEIFSLKSADKLISYNQFIEIISEERSLLESSTNSSNLSP